MRVKTIINITTIFFIASLVIYLLFYRWQVLPVFLWKNIPDKNACPAYVTKRPDLTCGGVDSDDLKLLHNRISKYLIALNIPPKKMNEFEVAARLRPTNGILFKFRLTQVQMEEFLKGKSLINQSYKDTLKDWKKKDDIYYLLMSSYPYNKLSWWPIESSKVNHLKIYKGYLKWRSGDAQPGFPYYVFVNPTNRTIYIFGI